MRIVAAAAALVLLATPASARRKEKLPPGLAELVAAERAFAKRCGQVGLRASFLEFFAAEGISFAPDPGLARPRLESRKPDGLVRTNLDWAPAIAEISAGGDLGWTTGPVTF